MGTYNFDEDLKRAIKTEKDVGKILKSHGASSVSYNHDGEYDIIAKMKNGKVVTFEVKEDFSCGLTGNVALEYESRGKPSGIATTKAQFYIYVTHMKDCVVLYTMFTTGMLKILIRNHKYFKTVTGGDAESETKMYLFKVDSFLKYGKLIHKIGGA